MMIIITVMVMITTITTGITTAIGFGLILIPMRRRGYTTAGCALV